MNLGKTIYRLRTERQLSQDELAERLQVSRQAVSKWENDNAVPDLDKLVKLAELFGVTLDELVQGKPSPAAPPGTPDKAGPAEAASGEAKPPSPGWPARKIVGTILLCTGLAVTAPLLALGGGLMAPLLASPLFLCGGVCLICKRHTGLWCAWALYLCVDLFLNYATGTSRSIVRLTFLWTAQMNYAVLVLAWVLVLALLALMAATALALRKSPPANRRQLGAAWLAFVLAQAANMFLPLTPPYQFLLEHIHSLGILFELLTCALDWARIVAATAALVVTARLLHARRKRAR